MTSTSSQPAAAGVPGAVVAVRGLVSAQSAAALAAAALLGRVVVTGLSDGQADFGRVLGAVVLTSFAAVLLAVGVTLIVGAIRLRRGAESIRTTLVVVESVLAGGVLYLLGGEGRNLGFGALPLPAVVVGVTAAATLAGLLLPSLRAWTAR